MPAYLLLVSPGANRVYAGEAPRLAAAELALTCPVARDVRPLELAGVGYVGFSTAAPLDGAGLAEVARQSAVLGLYEWVARDDPAPPVPCSSPPTGGTTPPDRAPGSRSVRDDSAGYLVPVALPQACWFPDDLVTIPKYPGKTNEQFTHLLVHLTLARSGVAWPVPGGAAPSPPARPRPSVLDPLAGRGTTLLTAWRLGCDGFGVEADDRTFEALAAYVTTYLRRTRRKHAAATAPVRREGRKLGRRYDAADEATGLTLAVFTGDTRDSAALFGKRRFDAVVADAPYGVVHGARATGSARERSPADLLRAALPVWAGQLRPGGALGLAWNTYGLARADLLDLLSDAGLTPCAGGPWDDLAHRVDSSIRRDLVVAVKPG